MGMSLSCSLLPSLSQQHASVHAAVYSADFGDARLAGNITQRCFGREIVFKVHNV